MTKNKSVDASLFYLKLASPLLILFMGVWWKFFFNTEEKLIFYFFLPFKINGVFEKVILIYLFIFHFF